MHEPDVILFDLDDTIVDFTWNQVSAWRDACELANERTGADVDELQASILTLAKRYWADEARSERGRRDLRAAGAEIVAMAFDELGVRGDPSCHGRWRTTTGICGTAASGCFLGRLRC